MAAADSLAAVPAVAVAAVGKTPHQNLSKIAQSNGLFLCLKSIIVLIF